MSLIHFEFIFVYGVRECSNFILESYLMEIDLMTFLFLYPLLIKHIRKLKSFTVVMHINVHIHYR